MGASKIHTVLNSFAQAMTKRANAYKKYELDSDLITAGISHERELDNDSNGWGFVML